MAAHMVSIARREYGSDWRLIGSGEQSQAGSKMPKPLEGTPVEPVRVRYSYYTAGSGGVGPTILETSFLLAGTDVVVYRDGKKARQALSHRGTLWVENCSSHQAWSLSAAN